MKIMVCVKYVPDTDEVLMDTQHSLVRNARNQKLNPADESALEAALQLAGTNGDVTVLTMGASFCAEPMSELLARGATRAVLLTDKELAGSDSLATAYALAAAIKLLGPFDLILCGRRALDGETGQVPAELAVRLDFPCVTNLVKITQDTANAVSCVRLLEEGEHTLRVQTPAVLTLCEYTYPLRMPSLSGLIRAKRVPIRVVDAAALGLSPGTCGLAGSPTRVKKVTPQQAGHRSVKKLSLENGAETLAQLIGQMAGDHL